jgi:hypothetical protein
MRIFGLLFILISFTACSSKKNVMKDAANKNFTTKINLHISLTAENLSEDGAKLYSQNDEIVFLVYIVNSDTTKLPELILAQYCVFDSLKRNADFISDSLISPVNGDLCFVMIEVDGDKNKEQIEPVVRLNLRTINSAYVKNDIQTLTTFLGDDDLLGINFVSPEKLNLKKENSVVISGNHLFDAYKYILTFKS